MNGSTERESSGQRNLPSFRLLLAAALGILVLLWIAPVVAATISAIDLSGVQHPYAMIAGFVVLDAVVPIFPSESLLTTASNLAAQDDSNIQLWKLIAAGTIGAIAGDSLLYWLSRTVLRRRMAAQVKRAEQNEKAARALEVMGDTAPLLIVFGRFVPGLRFIVGATMGLTRYSYPRFLLWDSMGGLFWATYTCVFSYLVASIIEDQPLISIAVSVIVTTAMLGLMYRPIKRRWDASGSEPDQPPSNTRT